MDSQPNAAKGIFQRLLPLIPLTYFLFLGFIYHHKDNVDPLIEKILNEKSHLTTNK